MQVLKSKLRHTLLGQEKTRPKCRWDGNIHALLSSGHQHRCQVLGVMSAFQSKQRKLLKEKCINRSTIWKVSVGFTIFLLVLCT